MVPHGWARRSPGYAGSGVAVRVIRQRPGAARVWAGRPAPLWPCSPTAGGVRSPSCHPAPAAAVSRSICAQLRRCPPSSAGVLLTHLSVHEPVDDLCKKTAGLCTCGEILGISAAAHAHIKAVTCENTIRTLCIKERVKLSTRHAIMADKEAEHLSEIYPAVIQAQDRGPGKSETGCLCPVRGGQA
jgi:hypothetical protein